MGTIQVPGRLSGRTYSINIKGDTPSETEQARIRSFVEQREAQFAQRYQEQLGKPLAEPDDGTALGRGFARGVPQIKSTLGTTVETIGQQLGIAGLANYGRGMEEAAQRRLFDLSLQQPAPTTREDVAAAEGVFPTIGKALTFAGELAGEQAPQLGVGLAGGAAGAVAGGLAAGPAGALAGFGVGSGLTEAPLLFGSNVQRQEEEVAAGRKEAVDLTDALGATVGQAALTSVTNALAGAGVFVRPGARLFTRAVSGAAVGGTTEGLNEVGQQMLERYQAGLPVDSPDAIKEYIDAGVAGGILGFGAGGIGGAIGGPRVQEETPLRAPAKPGPAKVSEVGKAVSAAGGEATQIELSDGAVLTIEGDAAEADIARAVDQHNQTKAAAASKAAPPAKIEEPPAAEPDMSRPAGGVSIDDDLAEARGIYDERLALAEEGGADPEEAKRIAAQAAVNYVDSLQADTQKRLARFRNTMARMAAEPTVGVMPPDLPDSAYAQEFGEAVQQDLFEVPAEVPAVAAAPEPVETRPAAAMDEAPKPVQVLTEETVDRLGVGKAKSASLRKLVGKPLTDTKVIRALDSWAQNDRATPENKALAVSLITGQPAVEPVAEVPTAPAPEPEPEIVDDTTPAAPEPEAVGVSAEDGQRSVGELGQPVSDSQPAEEPAAPDARGLGGDMSVPVGADTAAGAEPAALTEPDAPKIEDVRDYNALPGAVLGAARQRIPAAIAPAEAPRAVAEEVRKESVMKRLVQFFMQRATPSLRRYTTATGGINSPSTWKFYPDWMPLEDQSKVVQLLGRLNRSERDKYKFTLAEVEPLSREAEAAHTYFSKTIRPVDAIALMIDDLTADYEIYEGSLRPGMTEIEHRDLMAGTGSEVARRALDWVRNNLSPKTNEEIDLQIKKDADVIAVQEAWLSDIDRVEQGRAERKEARKVRAEQAAESGYGTMDLAAKMAAADPLVALDRYLHYSVKAALNAGDLKGALRSLAATTNNADVKALANRFADLAGTTRVKVLYPGDPARNIGNNRGIYWQSPDNPERQNIIYLNGQTGMDAHTLLHEMAHAVTFNLVDMQPNHPTVKQLEQLLSRLREVAPKDQLWSGPFYGLRSVKEMVAEAYGRAGLGESDNGLRDLMKSTVYKTYTPATKELPLTNWERFKEIVGNFLRGLIGRPSKPYPRKTVSTTIEGQETGLDRFHRLVDGLLSEAPQVLPDTAMQKAIGSPLVARNVLNNAVKTAPVWNANGRKRLGGLMASAVPQPLRRAMLGLLQLDWFNDLAGKYFPQIAELKNVDDLRRGKINTLNANVKPVLEDLLAYARKSPELYNTLVAIQGQATLAEVDPTEPQSKYAGDKEKSDIWLDLNRQLTTADSTGEMRALFRKTRNVLRSYRAEIERVLKSRIKDITDDKVQQNQLFAQLMKKLDEENAIDPYFSLMRRGDYWLEYTAEDTTGAPVSVDPLGNPQRPTARFVQAFESPFALAQFRAQLEAKTDAQGNPVAWDFEENRRPISDMNREGYVPPTFVQGALNIIGSFDRADASPEERAKIDDARDAIHSMFLRLTPDHSLLKSFIKRKGTRGFMGDITPLGVIDAPLDMVQALAEKTSTLSYQLANIEYGGKIQQLINKAGETRNKLAKSAGLTLEEKSAVDAYHDEFVDRAKFAKNPQVTGAAQLARGITFNMTLGFSIAGAANNLMQIPMIGATELGGRYGMRSAMRELGFAMRALRNAGKSQKVLSYGADGRELRTLDEVDNFGSIANYFEPDENGKLQLRSDIKIPAKLRDKIADLDVLAEVMMNNGMLVASMSQEMLEAESGWLHRINRWGGFLMHHAERFNRQSMAVAAYNLELAKINGRASPEAKLAAAMKAVEITERVNGTIGASTAPRLAQSAVGSVVFMFKRFGLHMARYIIGTANQALRGASPEDRAVARYQIVGMLGATALFAGVQGLPFFSELMTLFNLFFTEDDEERPEVLVQKFLGEPYYHGALNYLLGIEIASRISMSGLIFRENKIEKDQSVLYDLFEMFGGPAVGVFMNTERGIDLLSQGELYRGVETMMPSAIKSIMKAVRFQTEGATTLRGDEIVPLTPVDIVRQVIGYTPEAYARQQERVSGAKRIDEAVRDKKRKLLRKYNLALREGDFADVREILKEMREFSRRYPEDAISSETLERSARSFQQRSEEMISGVSFTNSGRARAEQYIGGFEEDTSLWGT